MMSSTTSLFLARKRIWRGYALAGRGKDRIFDCGLIYAVFSHCSAVLLSPKCWSLRKHIGSGLASVPWIFPFSWFIHSSFTRSGFERLLCTA